MPVRRQLGVALDDELRERLAAAAEAKGHSIAEEVRQRVQQTFDAEAFDRPTRDLMRAIGGFAVLVRLQTNHTWHSHPAANRVMRYAITARHARLQPKGEAVFAPNELPASRLVASDDLEAMGLGLEAIDFHTRPLDEQQSREFHEQTRKELLERYPHLKDKE